MSSPTHFTIAKDFDFRNRDDRTMILNFDDGDYHSASLNVDIWHSIMPIALRGAPSNIRYQILEELEEEGVADVEVDVSDHSLSLFELLHVIKRTAPPLAMELSRCWLEVPLEDCASNTWVYLGYDAVHAQLRAKFGEPEAVFDSQVPTWLTEVIDAADRTGLAPLSGVQWRYADTPLGKTCLAYSHGDAGPCLVISDCEVRYSPAGSEGTESALAALKLLQGYLDQAEILQTEMPGKNLSAHEVLKMSAAIEQWRNRILDV